MISNFVLNSMEDAIKVAKNGGIIMRVLEAINQSKSDHKVQKEANFLINSILR